MANPEYLVVEHTVTGSIDAEPKVATTIADVSKATSANTSGSLPQSYCDSTEPHHYPGSYCHLHLKNGLAVICSVIY